MANRASLRCSRTSNCVKGAFRELSGSSSVRRTRDRAIIVTVAAPKWCSASPRSSAPRARRVQDLETRADLHDGADDGDELTMISTIRRSPAPQRGHESTSGEQRGGSERRRWRPLHPHPCHPRYAPPMSAAPTSERILPRFPLRYRLGPRQQSFVGRHDELELLDVLTHRSTVAWVWGAGGRGKSSLV